ncbi:MAG TPA: putative molybdenum carrier protein [Pedococcus sp.]|nr:putative molybdenum carrier protein [Pedococcus sp.]
MAVGRVVSGGQSGVDRAALDVALALAVPYAGWCPAGGLAEDLPEPPGLLARYPALRPTRTSDPSVRTERNVVASDATLVLVPGAEWHSPGTDHTLDRCRRHGRPHLVATLDDGDAAGAISAWLQELPDGLVLNVAGPRESQAPGVYEAARRVLGEVLAPERGS